jgi:hypothetical protein
LFVLAPLLWWLSEVEAISFAHVPASFIGAFGIAHCCLRLRSCAGYLRWLSEVEATEAKASVLFK